MFDLLEFQEDMVLKLSLKIQWLLHLLNFALQNTFFYTTTPQNICNCIYHFTSPKPKWANRIKLSSLVSCKVWEYTLKICLTL